MTTQLSPLPVQKFFDNNGIPLAGGLLYTYQAGTSTPQQTFIDSNGVTPNTNPIILNSRGEANIWLTSGQSYKFSLQDAAFNTIWTVDKIISGVTSDFDFYGPLANSTDTTKGASLIGYFPPWAGAVGRTVSQRLQDYIDATDFGLKTTNTGAQNNTAISTAISYAISIGGATLHIPHGTYDFASAISLTGANNLRITGDGIDSTILRTTSATADLFTQTGTTYYQSIDNLTLTSSVTRTAGAMFTTGMWKRGLLYRVKVSQHFNGVNFTQFEQSVMSEVNVVSPSGAGTGVIFGTASATNQGANLTMIDCFLRGNDETNSAASPVGLVGLAIYDVQAVFVVNTDIGSFKNQIMVVAPQTSCQNCYFVQTFFDGTVQGDNVLVQGAGLKSQFTFNGCWFNGAGKFAPGAADCMGVNFTNTGTYADWQFTGCRWIFQTGAGVLCSTPQSDFNFSGCTFVNCGDNTTTFKTSVYFSHAVAQTQPALFTGCKVISNPAATADMIFSTANSVGNVITGCQMPKGISYVAGTIFGECSGNSDGTTDTIASVATLLVSPNKNYYNITGTTSVTGINRTYPGHIITFVANAAFTWTNGSNLHLAGSANFTTATGSTLVLMCEPVGGGWREITRHA